MAVGLVVVLVVVFPAHAGMSPIDQFDVLRSNRFPRSRGDEPRVKPKHGFSM